MEKTTEQKASDYALFLLGIKLRTEGEMRERLRSKNYKPDIIDAVIKSLKDSRYINDRGYAEVYLENLKKYRNFGFYGIKKKFMEKRLSSGIIESVLNEGLGGEEELKIARRFFNREKMAAGTQEEKAKAARKLAAKGFRSESIAKIVFGS